jgi:hypothetical protein
VNEYIKAQFRQFSKFTSVSLDAQLFDDGNATLLDRLSTDADTGYWDPNMMHRRAAENDGARRGAPKRDGLS